MSTTQRQSSFHVGDWVSADFGQRKFTGVIVEDLGALGIQGRRLFQVDFPMDPFEPWRVMLQEDEMQAIAPGTETVRSIDKQSIMNYLVYGGLISILRSNLSGGKNQPRAWLCLNQLGNVTHTFVPERGVVGGQVVPSGALYNSKILTAKRDLVLSFVESFGFNRREAENIVAEVGTAP